MIRALSLGISTTSRPCPLPVDWFVDPAAAVPWDGRPLPEAPASEPLSFPPTRSSMIFACCSSACDVAGAISSTAARNGRGRRPAMDMSARTGSGARGMIA